MSDVQDNAMEEVGAPELPMLMVMPCQCGSISCFATVVGLEHGVLRKTEDGGEMLCANLQPEEVDALIGMLMTAREQAYEKAAAAVVGATLIQP
jgi:hypothetical protein